MKPPTQHRALFSRPREALAQLDARERERLWRWGLRVVGRARAEMAALIALFVIGLGLWAFLELAEMVEDAGGRGLDQRILMWLRPHDDLSRPIGPWWLNEAMADITSLGGIAVLGLFALIAAGFLLMRRRPGSVLRLIAALVGGVVLSEGLKDIFERDRPAAVFRTVETLNASFPSGHALLSTVFYLTLAVMIARSLERRRLKAYVVGAGVALALLVGISRVYLGAHWASDVLAGWSVGATWAMALWLVSHLAERAMGARAERRQTIHRPVPR
ncbi:MAG: phosphatase PAP2 family protein [Brevundimonas sp.]|uniref:phosphatase PAP2 family protein n=1 Tax=Brevundimonas sp. TaxID=1871086 RepID=UPI00391C5AE9